MTRVRFLGGDIEYFDGSIPARRKWRCFPQWSKRVRVTALHGKVVRNTFGRTEMQITTFRTVNTSRS